MSDGREGIDREEEEDDDEEEEAVGKRHSDPALQTSPLTYQWFAQPPAEPEREAGSSVGASSRGQEPTQQGDPRPRPGKDDGQKRDTRTGHKGRKPSSHAGLFCFRKTGNTHPPQRCWTGGQSRGFRAGRKEGTTAGSTGPGAKTALHCTSLDLWKDPHPHGRLCSRDRGPRVPPDC